MNAALAPPPGLVRCPVCLTMLAGPWAEGAENARACARCGCGLLVSVFPALRQPVAARSETGAPALEGEATCFFHPAKRAEHTCDRCGRFVCALCHLPLGGRQLCPSCLKAGQPAEALPELVVKRVSWARLSFLIGLIPYLPVFWFFTIFTGPAAVFFGLYAFFQPGSLVLGKRPLTALLGLLLGAGQIAMVVWFFYGIWKGATVRVH